MRITWAVLLSATFALAACSDDGNDPPSGTVDAPTGGTVDAPPSGTVDAPPSGAKQLGSMCVPSAMNPQGDCEAGFLCLQLQGGSHAWCSKPCMPMMDTCAQGYTGPGLAACFLTVTPEGGGNAQTVCGVVCSDETGNNSICPAATCNGTCPAALMCTAELKNQQMMTVAKGCQ